MLRLSKKVEYALISILELARQDELEPLTAKYLALRHQIPQELLGKILQALTRQGILNSVQGVKGGYVLAKKPETIYLKNIIEILDGPIALIGCNGEDDCGCSQFTACNIKSPMEMIQSELAQYFSNISINDLKAQYSEMYAGKQKPLQNTTSVR